MIGDTKGGDKAGPCMNSALGEQGSARVDGLAGASEGGGGKGFGGSRTTQLPLKTSSRVRERGTAERHLGSRDLWYRVGVPGTTPEVSPKGPVLHICVAPTAPSATTSTFQERDVVE